jgi:hypothetical protein
VQNLSAIPCVRKIASQLDTYLASAAVGFCGIFSPSRSGDSESETRDGCDHLSDQATDAHVISRTDEARRTLASAPRRHCSGWVCVSCVISALGLMLLLMLASAIARSSGKHSLYARHGFSSGSVLRCHGTAAEHAALTHSNRCRHHVVGHGASGCIDLVQQTLAVAVFESPATVIFLRTCRASSAAAAAVGAMLTRMMTQVRHPRVRARNTATAWRCCYRRRLSNALAPSPRLVCCFRMPT